MDKGLEKHLFSKYVLGDMCAHYIKDERGNIELLLIPVNREKDITDFKISRGDSLIQVKLLGDQYPGTLSGGTTMRNSLTTEKLQFVSQDEYIEDFATQKLNYEPLDSSLRRKKRIIRTVMTDGKKHTYIHYLGYTEGDYALESYTEFVNEDEKNATLEMLSSFSLSEMTPFVDGEGTDRLKVHRIRSKWSHEGRLLTQSVDDLQLEVSWTGWHVNSERFGSIGSMPVKLYSPFGAIEDSIAGVIWGAQLMIESSWQMEFYRRDEAIAFSGGIADREFGDWQKTIKPGETFRTPTAILTVCELNEDKTSLIDYTSQRMTHFVDKYVELGPKSEQHLPVLFNEYCTTWGLPSYDNIDGILKAIKGHGLEYFVVDCGWFVEEGKSWGNGMGDYIPSDILFPKGLKSIADRIREDDLVPGIWYEIDNVGKDSHAYNERFDLLHTRDGYTLTTRSRRFFDMRKPEVIKYLDEKVIAKLIECGFGYMKMDYNDTIGLGVDTYKEDGTLDRDISLGEGLRADREASVDYVRKVLKEVPDIILENCASGGHRLEPLMMSICSMASFSDAHECEHIPSIAGNLVRTILPRQSQIWAVIRKEDALKRISWTLINTMLGRMCFSGDVTELTNEQWECIDLAIAFYKEVAPIIKNGYTHIFDCKGSSDRHLVGYQAYVREKTSLSVDEYGCKGLSTKGCDEALVTVHMYEVDKNEPIKVKLPNNCPDKIKKTYAGTDVSAEIKDGYLYVYPEEGKMEAIALLLKADDN